MKKAFLILTALLICTPAFAGEEHKKCPDGYKSTLTDDPKLHHHSRHTHCYIDTDTDTDTNTHNNEKDPTDFKGEIGVKIENFIRVTENQSVEISGAKDVVDTNSSEGWWARVMYVINWTALDLRKNKD